jgi:nucleotide-binding universal stress UspA family protein
VFLGTHGLTGLNRILLGSTAERVVNGAPCPVITIRQTQPTEDQPEPQGKETLGSEQKSPSIPSHLLVPMDFSDCSLEAVEYGLQVAKEFEVSATLLHVMEPMTYSLDFNLTHRETQKHQREEAQKRMTEVAEVFQARLQGIKEVEPDLIVMGTHGRRGFSRLLLGSVATALLRQAPIPLLTVKSPKYAPTHPRRGKDAKSKTFSTTG